MFHPLSTDHCHCSPEDVSRVSVAGSSQYRATWIPTQYYSRLSDDDFATLASLGVRNVYLDVWNNGRVFFRSSTVENAIGAAGFAGDMLGKFTKMAEAHGITVHAWFEYGLICGYGSNGQFCQYAKKQGWTLGIENGFDWMSPSGGALTFLISMMNDLHTNYPSVASSQLDDHFACPSAFGACSISAMTTAARKVSESVRGTVTIAPAPRSFAYNSLNVDWVSWINNGYFPVAFPQLYFSEAQQFSAELASELNYVSSSKLVAGVRVDGSGSNTAWAQVEGMLKAAESQHVGVSIWYCAGILDLYPSGFKTLWG